MSSTHLTVRRPDVVRFTREENLAACNDYLATLASGRSREAMAGRLKAAALVLGYDDPSRVDWSSLDGPTIARIRAALLDAGKKPSTTNATIFALRGVSRALNDRGMLDDTTLRQIVKVKPVRGGSDSPAGRHLSPGEVDSLMRACLDDDSVGAVRDAAIIALCVGNALRRAEIVAIAMNDLDLERQELKVHGKGRRERTAHLRNGTLEALRQWVDLRGADGGPLFTAVLKSGRIVIRKLSTQSVFRVIEKRALEAGIGTVRPHDLRRTCAGSLLDAGVDLSTTQRILGHQSIETTTRYDLRPARRQAEGIERLNIYFRKRELTDELVRRARG